MKQMDAQIKKEGWGDTDRSDGFKKILASGNVNLITPFTFTEYGDSYTITGDINLDTSSSTSSSFPATTSSSDNTSVSTGSTTSTSTVSDLSVAALVYNVIPTSASPKSPIHNW
jgi:hypothetical protein